MILEAVYEATMWAAALNAQRGASNVVFLTLLGGGAFGNQSSWIHAAIRRALNLMKPSISTRTRHGPPSKDILALAEEFELCFGVQF